MTAEDFTRLANNFYTSKGMVADYNRLSLDSYLINYIEGHKGECDVRECPFQR